MSKDCGSYVVPNLINDPCEGEKTPAECVIDSNVFLELGLQANSTQKEINQKLYATILAQKLKIEQLETQINNL